MAFKAFQKTSEGTYGEGAAYSAASYLQELKAALDRGEVSVSDYLKIGRPIAEQAYRDIAQISSGGSKAANAVNPAMSLLQQAGFVNKGINGQFKIMPQLGSQYEQQVRESLLPPGLTPEQKAAYLNEIPTDVEFGSDQYDLEKEGLRQKFQQEQTLGKQKTARAKMIDDLTNLLNKNTETQFNRSIPQIAENANTAGIFRSTGYGEALAKHRTQLEEDTANTLGRAKLDLENADINTLADIESNLQGFQTSGLERRFSLDDFEKSAKYAREMAELSKPQAHGKTRGEKWAQGSSLALEGGKTVVSAKNGGKGQGK